MATSGWEKAPNGKIAAPVAAWDAVIGGTYVLLRIQYGEHEHQDVQAVQVGMTAEQARLLADDLRIMADRLDEQDWGEAQEP